MRELKRFLVMVWHVTLASLASLLVYFPLGLILQAATNDRVDDGSFFVLPVIIYVLYELCFLVILWWMRFHHNDELEIEFMKEYSGNEWKGKKEDLIQALKWESLTYVFVFAVIIFSCAVNIIGIRNPLAVLYSPLTLMQTAVPPVLACILSLFVFAGGYTLIVSLVRDSLATTVRSASGSNYGTRSYIQSRRGIHRK